MLLAIDGPSVAARCRTECACGERRVTTARTSATDPPAASTVATTWLSALATRSRSATSSGVKSGPSWMR